MGCADLLVKGIDDQNEGILLTWWQLISLIGVQYRRAESWLCSILISHHNGKNMLIAKDALIPTMRFMGTPIFRKSVKR